MEELPLPVIIGDIVASLIVGVIVGIFFWELLPHDAWLKHRKLYSLGVPLIAALFLCLALNKIGYVIINSQPIEIKPTPIFTEAQSNEIRAIATSVLKFENEKANRTNRLR